MRNFGCLPPTIFMLIVAFLIIFPFGIFAKSNIGFQSPAGELCSITQIKPVASTLPKPHSDTLRTNPPGPAYPKPATVK